MPGTITIDTRQTFSASPIAMTAGPKMKFGTDQQEVNRDGERKWTVQAAVSYFAENGIRPVSEVIDVTVTGGNDPALTIQPGTPVEFERLRCGISAPEKSEETGRIRGGKLYFMATAVRVANGQRPPQPKDG